MAEQWSAWTGLTVNVATGYFWLFWLHVAVTVAPFVVRLFRPIADIQDYLRRALGWWLVTGSALIALALGPAITVAYFCWVGLIGLREFLTFLPVRFSPATRAAAHVLVVCHYVAAWMGREPLLWVSVTSLALVPLLVMLAEDVDGYLARTGALMLMLFVTGCGLGHVAVLVNIPLARNPVGGGAGLLMFSVFVTQFNDLAQYVWGKALKGPRITPIISPRKTWAGFLGGAGTVALTAGWLAPFLTPLSTVWACALGGFMAVAGFVGDITISALKRDAGVKDTGTILPGFGGVLDRVDSLIFSIPAFVHLLAFLGLS